MKLHPCGWLGRFIGMRCRVRGLRIVTCGGRHAKGKARRWEGGAEMAWLLCKLRDRSELGGGLR
eukprot:121768-Chlamydomonas_euryale.AAC.1